MAERDRFELDLAAALRTYLEEAPTEVRPTELARHFATAYPHGTTTFGPWPFAAIPRLAWVLLLGAALLAALVGGTLLVGSQMQRRLPAVVPPIGQLFECPPGSNPDKPGPVDQARPPRDIVEAMAFDRSSGRIVLLGSETWTFDVCTNTWTEMHPSRQPDNGAEMNPMVYDADSDVTVAYGVEGPVWAYDLEADSWLEKTGPPGGGRLLFYDPISGHVVGLDDASGLWNYEVDTDTWTPIRHEARPDSSGEGVDFFAYDTSVDRMVAYANHEFSGKKTRLFDIRTGRWSETGALTPSFGSGFGGYGKPSIAYDEAAKRTVISGGNAGLAAYDATADLWEILVKRGTGLAPSSSWVAIVYDPVNERLVGRGQYTESRPDGRAYVVDDLVAFDLVTREWTVLLEPGEGQLAP